jgi:uncharacterized protein
MLGKLTDPQIDHVLHSQFIGRIGCSTEGNIYIVPVTYVYHDGYIYAHAKEGEKVQMMRKNPKVCFEVDIIDTMTNWRSVIVWGEYEELKDKSEQRTGMKIMNDRLAPFVTSETVRTSESSAQSAIIEKGLKAVAYRIRVTKKTGRFEKR